MELQELLKDILYIVITMILPIVVKYLITLLQKKTEQIVSQKCTSDIAEIIYRVESVVSNVVLSISQTYVDSLKTKGEFTKETAEIAKQEAVLKTKELVSDECKNVIGEIYGSFDNWLDVQIEKEVRENK